MREIKFRAWKDGRMMEGNSIGSIRANVGVTSDLMVAYTVNGFFSDLQKKGYIFMQYTGLKDKNGKEIYEGDLLKISMGGDIQNEFYKVENMWDLRIGMENNDSYMRIDNELEVIGNVYENSELLK